MRCAQGPDISSYIILFVGKTRFAVDAFRHIRSRMLRESSRLVLLDLVSEFIMLCIMFICDHWDFYLDIKTLVQISILLAKCQIQH